MTTMQDIGKTSVAGKVLLPPTTGQISPSCTARAFCCNTIPQSSSSDTSSQLYLLPPRSLPAIPPPLVGCASTLEQLNNAFINGRKV